MEIAVAIIGALALVGAGTLGRRAERRRDRISAISDTARACEDFIREALAAIAALQLVAATAPRLRLLPPTRFTNEAIADAVRSQREVGRTHARVRRVASDEVAAASDRVLDAIGSAANLASRRDRRASEWDAVWSDAREARIDFEQLVRMDGDKVEGRRRRS